MTTSTANPYAPEAALPTNYGYVEHALVQSDQSPDLQPDRDAVLAELWELAEAGVNTTRIVDLVATSWQAVDDVWADARAQQSKESHRAEQLSKELQTARVTADNADDLREREHNLRVSLQEMIAGWAELAERIQKLPGRGNATRLIRAVRTGTRLG